MICCSLTWSREPLGSEGESLWKKSMANLLRRFANPMKTMGRPRADEDERGRPHGAWAPQGTAAPGEGPIYPDVCTRHLTWTPRTGGGGLEGEWGCRADTKTKKTNRTVAQLRRKRDPSPSISPGRPGVPTQFSPRSLRGTPQQAPSPRCRQSWHLTTHAPSDPSPCVPEPQCPPQENGDSENACFRGGCVPVPGPRWRRLRPQ